MSFNLSFLKLMCCGSREQQFGSAFLDRAYVLIKNNAYSLSIFFCLSIQDISRIIFD